MSNELTIQDSQSLDAVIAEEKRFELAQRQANVYAKSTLVPKQYQGNVGNVLIATNMARRMGADLLMVMQNLYIVHGNPAWSSQFLIATFNANGRFSAVKYRWKGKPETDDWGCQAYCTEIATGDEITGAWVTWKMAKSEGWVTKNGSKWQTMPEQMFQYRAAAFMIRTTAPEISMGLLTVEELRDIDTHAGDDYKGVASATQASIQELKASLTAPEPATVDAEIVEEDAEGIDLETLRADVAAYYDEWQSQGQRELLEDGESIHSASEERLRELLNQMGAE